MEPSNQTQATTEQVNKENVVYTAYAKTRSWISSALGIILTVVGFLVVFILSSLEGTREVRANNSTGGKILEAWRAENPDDEDGFPEEIVDIVDYEGKSYYFVATINEQNEVVDWYFAYDGGLGYVFADYKFYVLTAITVSVSVYISYVNYLSTVKTNMNTAPFLKTLGYYQEKKEACAKDTQYISDFCAYKNKQAYDAKKSEIVADAEIDYDYYCSKSFDASTLEKWQKRRLKKIRRIKIKRIHPSDLLQEHGQITSYTVSLLPMGQAEHQRKFLISGIVQKTITSALSGLVVAFGIVLGNWVLGLSYGLTLLISYVSTVVIATDFVQTTLRNRFITKGDILNEFSNIKTRFYKKAEENKEQVAKAQQPAIVKIETPEASSTNPINVIALAPIASK